jgi:hypothetical protein
MFTRERSGSAGRDVVDDDRVVVAVVAVLGAGLVGAVEVVLDCFAGEPHAVRRAIASAAHVRRTLRG